MNDRVFLDTNVLIYGQSTTDAVKREIVRSLPDEYAVVLSTQVLSECANVFTRKQGLSAEEARQRLLLIAQGCEVLPLTREIVFDALRIAACYRYRFYDSQIIAAALAAGAAILFSEDMQHRKIIDGTLVIRSPFRSEAHAPVARYRAKARGAKAATGKRRK